VLRIHGVVSGADDERRDVDVAEVSGAVPVLEDAAETELARSLHGNVDRLVDVTQRPRHRLRPLVEGEPAHVMDVVMLHEQLLVPRIVRRPLTLHALDLAQRVLVHRRHQDPLGVLVVEP
jgi:hypothetical protein